MKTSNKLLLGYLFSIIILVVATYVTLYAKYKSGQIVNIGDRNKEWSKRYVLGKFKAVSVTDLGNCIINEADSAIITVSDVRDNSMHFKIIGDTLFINGDSLPNSPDRRRNYGELTLSLPSQIPVTANFSEVRLGGKSTRPRPNFDFTLNHSSLEGAGWDTRSEPLIFGSINIQGDSSEINFNRLVNIDTLSITGNVTNFNDQNTSIGNLKLILDSNSHVTLSGANIRNLSSFP